MIKSFVKILVGAIRIKFFHVKAGKRVYIGEHCNLKGNQHITLENSVTIRPYAQIWSGGSKDSRRI